MAALIFDRRAVAQRRMRPDRIVEIDDVVGDVGFGLLVIGIVALPDALYLQVQEEPLHHGGMGSGSRVNVGPPNAYPMLATAVNE